ncbi:hypothetical protein BOTBODRAFT_214612 [Botryobasidium botryosum FD-172 SS1]|uniref:Uncharacterized protein n=1 Tax=Botryobasidium botryosum (strain FD-172 SS1) TaxID=930990 RepID=A0A067NDL2_BOTB1|nr:hypothetical protein BOTBODRAFT_214612 [Botryobasidium botryosum FD-172 SS1]
MTQVRNISIVVIAVVIGIDIVFSCGVMGGGTLANAGDAKCHSLYSLARRSRKPKLKMREAQRWVCNNRNKRCFATVRETRCPERTVHRFGDVDSDAPTRGGKLRLTAA